MSLNNESLNLKIKILHDEFVNFEKNWDIPILLRHQIALLDINSNRPTLESQEERDIEMMLTDAKLLQIRLPLSKVEYGLLYRDEYFNLMKKCLYIQMEKHFMTHTFDLPYNLHDSLSFFLNYSSIFDFSTSTITKQALQMILINFLNTTNKSISFSKQLAILHQKNKTKYQASDDTSKSTEINKYDNESKETNPFTLMINKKRKIETPAYTNENTYINNDRDNIKKEINNEFLNTKKISLNTTYTGLNNTAITSNVQTKIQKNSKKKGYLFDNCEDHQPNISQPLSDLAASNISLFQNTSPIKQEISLKEGLYDNARYIKMNDICSPKSLFNFIKYVRTPSDRVESIIFLLFQASILTRLKNDIFLFTLPQMGEFCSSLTKGRRQIINFLKRSKYKEKIRKDVENLKLKNSRLSPNFHILDLLGKGWIENINTPSGFFLRLNMDDETISNVLKNK